MAVTSLQRPCLFSSSGHGFLSRRVRVPSSFALRALNSDDPTPEERARMSLKELDDQLLSMPPPREFAGIELEDKENEAPAKGRWLELSDTFFKYLAGGLVLLTIVNNILFYYFVELPYRERKATQEKEVSFNKPSVDSSNTAAPQLQAQTDL